MRRLTLGVLLLLTTSCSEGDSPYAPQAFQLAGHWTLIGYKPVSAGITYRTLPQCWPPSGPIAKVCIDSGEASVDTSTISSGQMHVFLSLVGTHKDEAGRLLGPFRTDSSYTLTRFSEDEAGGSYCAKGDLDVTCIYHVSIERRRTGVNNREAWVMEWTDSCVPYVYPICYDPPNDIRAQFVRQE